MSLSKNEEIALMKEMEAFDTPTVTNAIATYPGRDDCLGLYDPQEIDWYTDDRLRSLFPEIGPRCGYAATAVYGMVDPAYNLLSFRDILEGIQEMEGPVVLVLKENFNEKMKRRNALIGGNMMTAFKQMGVVGVIGDAPARDLEEMRPLGVACLFTGLAPGHGSMTIQAVNAPVTVSGMAVCPNEIIHMDVNGAVKFPRKYLKAVLENCKSIQKGDTARQNDMKHMTDPAEIAAAMKNMYK